MFLYIRIDKTQIIFRKLKTVGLFLSFCCTFKSTQILAAKKESNSWNFCFTCPTNQVDRYLPLKSVATLFGSSSLFPKFLPLFFSTIFLPQFSSFLHFCSPLFSGHFIFRFSPQFNSFLHLRSPLFSGHFIFLWIFYFMFYIIFSINTGHHEVSFIIKKIMLKDHEVFSIIFC